MKWFKFYGQDFLTDPKMRILTIEEKMCWIVLLCLANAEDKGGEINFISPNEVMYQASIEFGSPMWESTKGFIPRFETLRLLHIRNVDTTTKRNEVHYDVTLTNFNKRQSENLTNAERQKRHRERLKKGEIKSNNSNTTLSNDSNARVDKIRTDKNRIEEIERSQNFLMNIPLEVIKEFSDQFNCYEAEIKGKAEDLYNYCLSKGKKYKDYKAFLRNALKKDFGLRRKEPPKEWEKPENTKVDEENLKKYREMKKSIFKS